jgi:phosphatidylserine decarboxylase
MKIHKEGYLPIAITFAIVGILLALFITFAFAVFGFVVLSTLLFSFLFLVIRFFRVPKRRINKVPDGIISPADGQIVIIEKCLENEYFKDERMKISIFMSINNVMQ